jgi:PadR family transcriptional regulator PadR
VSENNRRARFYKLTATGATQLETEIVQWRRMSSAVNTIIGDPVAWVSKGGH